jgi:hypothetical protein
MNEVKGEMRKLHKEELSKLYSSPDTRLEGTCKHASGRWRMRIKYW